MQYTHVVDPFQHQRDHFEKHRETKAWGLLWEQGTAKTKPVIDTAAWLYRKDEIDGLLVVAPPGVERNWNTDEIPKHLPPDVGLETRVEVFRTKKKGTKDHQFKMNSLMTHRGLSVLLISYDAFMTKIGKKTAWQFLKKRRALYVLDESHNIKTPKAKRTRSIVKSGVYGKYRRILTGTPIAASPFDLYSQIRFLDEDFWLRRGIGTAVGFRRHFGEWFTAEDCKQLHGFDPGYDKLIRYKNLEQLSEWVAEITDRVTKDEVLDLPPKLFSKRYVEMTDEQRTIYNELRTECMYQFSDGAVVTADLPIVQLLRFQQVLCGYVPVDEEEPKRLLSGKNPRISAMEDLVAEIHHQAIVWARFRHDVDQLMELFERLGRTAVRYDGSVGDDEKERNKLAFQNGEAQWFVGTAQTGGPGLTLHMAKTVVYYSNSFKLIDRLQSEDRAHRAGMDERPVEYVDLVVPETIDEKIIENLRDKVDIASTITGDTLKDWI